MVRSGIQDGGVEATGNKHHKAYVCGQMCQCMAMVDVRSCSGYMGWVLIAGLADGLGICK